MSEPTLADRFRQRLGGSTPQRAHKPPGSACGSQDEGPHLTDTGNALRVVARHGKDLRYCHAWKTWQVWDTRRWAEDTTGEVVRRVKETQADLYRETADRIRELRATGDDDERKGELARLTALLAHCLKWEDARAVARCLDLARSEPGTPVLPADLDRNLFAFNVANGTLNLRNGQLRPHDRKDLLTKLALVTFDPQAECPLWLKVLRRIMGGNDDLIGYLQRVTGYCLTGDVTEQSLWFFHGGGANGKSTFLDTLLGLTGDYGIQAVSELLMVKNHESHPTERADLFGKRLVCCIETEAGKRVAESLMKQLTGGDRIRARRMRQDFFEFSPTHKIILAANHKPNIVGTDHAVWRRIRLVPFTVTIPEEEKDKKLGEKLKAERSGILNWALAGCLAWQRNGLGEPDEVRAATAAYQAEQDTLAAFLAECCFLHAEARVRVSALFEEYGKWSGDKVTGLKAFNDRVRGRGYESKRGHGGAFFWHGIGLSGGAGEPG